MTAAREHLLSRHLSLRGVWLQLLCVGVGAAAGAAAGTRAARAESPFGSRAACAKLLGAGHRLARSSSVLRVGSWNLNGFPDGGPGAARRGRPRTDLAWLACSLAWMQLDVVALQGVKAHWRAKIAMRRLLARLRKLTGARWRYKLDRCRGAQRVHVGLLWNTGRVRAGKIGVEESLNPYRRACRKGQRPGLRGYFKARFGGGVDFHLLSVQLPTGGGLGQKLRRLALRGISEAYRSGRRLAPDPDMIVAGDFQAPARPWLARAAASLSSPFRLLENDRKCTGYAGRRGLGFSHFLVSKGMVELGASSRTRVSGYCATTGCTARRLGPTSAASSSLSPLCPVLLDVPNRDRDPTRQELGRWATKTYSTKVGRSGLPRKLSATMIKKVLHRLRGRLRRACRRHGSGAYRLTIVGATGKVTDVKRDGKAPLCALRVLRKAIFPRFQVSALQVLVPVIW